MGRPADIETRSHFGEPFVNLDYNQKRAICKHCSIECTGTTAKMKQHLAGCQPYVDLSVEARLAAEDSKASPDEPCAADKKRKLSQTTIGRVRVDSISKAEQQKADILLAKAIHVYKLPFDLFEGDLWDEYWSHVRPALKRPGRDRIGGDLLTKNYISSCLDIHRAMKSSIGVALCFTIDGLTDVKKRSVFNLMACAPMPYYLNFFRLNRLKESSQKLRDHLLKSIMEVEENIFRVSEEERVDLFAPVPNEIDIPPRYREIMLLLPKSDVRHWKMQYALCTDNPNVMRKTRRLLMKFFSEYDSWFTEFIAYGCSAHAFNSLMHDFIKIEPFKSVFRDSKIISSFCNQTHRALALLQHLMKQKYNKVYAILWFTLTRWLSILVLFTSILRAKAALRALTVYESEEGDQIDPFEFPDKVTLVLVSSEYWSQLPLVIDFLKPLGICTSYIEGDMTPLSAVYGCFQWLKRGFASKADPLIQRYPELSKFALKKLNHRYKTIKHSIMALAFLLDPFYDELVKSLGGYQNIELDGVTLMKDARDGLAAISPNKEIKLCLLTELHCWLRREEEFSDPGFIATGRLVHPVIFWGYTTTVPHLREAAVRVFSNPPSAAGGERNFKVRNAVHSKTRNSLGDSKIHQQTHISYNHTVLKRSLKDYRRTGTFELRMQEPVAFEEDYEVLYDPDLLEENEGVDHSSDSDDESVLTDPESAPPPPPAADADEARLYCFCRQPEGEFAMVQCTEEDCPKPDEWYHLKCLGIGEEDGPGEEEDWLCPLCE